MGYLSLFGIFIASFFFQELEFIRWYAMWGSVVIFVFWYTLKVYVKYKCEKYNMDFKKIFDDNNDDE